MNNSRYESLVGWRYLFRRQRQPRILFVGLTMLAVALCLLGLGYQLENTDGRTVAVFGAFTVGRGLMAGGALVFAMGLAVSLFGALNRSMTLFTAFSTFMVAIGVAEVIIVLAIMNGLHADLGQKIVSTKAHVIITAKDPSNHLQNYEALLEKIHRTPGVAGATAILETEVMLHSLINRVPTKMLGVSWRKLGLSSAIPEQMDAGCLTILDDRNGQCAPLLHELTKPKTQKSAERKDNFRTRRSDDALMAFPAPLTDQDTQAPFIVIGSEMRKNLAVNLNEEVHAISPFGDLGPMGPIPKKQALKIGGWFSSGMLEFDSHLIYADVKEVQMFLGLGDVVNQVQVKVRDIEDSGEVTAALSASLGTDFRVTDWRQRDKRLFSALQLEKIAMFIVLGINIILAAFSIVSTLVMTILERRKEVAIFSAMGANKMSIFRIFLTQGTFVGLIGATLGAVIGGGLSFALEKLRLPLNQEVYYISAIPISIELVDLALIIGVALLVSILSTIYPARLAARINTVEGLGA